MTPREVAEQQIKCLNQNIENLKIKKENDLSKVDPSDLVEVKRLEKFYDSQMELIESQKAEWEKVLEIK